MKRFLRGFLIAVLICGLSFVAMVAYVIFWRGLTYVDSQTYYVNASETSITDGVAIKYGAAALLEVYGSEFQWKEMEHGHAQEGKYFLSNTVNPNQGHIIFKDAFHDLRRVVSMKLKENKLECKISWPK